MKTIVIPMGAIVSASYVNDVRFDLSRGAEGTAFITDSSDKGPNGILVVDLASGKVTRRLNDHPSTKRDPAFEAVVEGKPVHVMDSGLPPKPLGMGSDGIAISPDGKTLYYCPLASRHLFSVSTDALADATKSDADVAGTVRDLGEKGASDGLESDAQGRIYATQYEHQAITHQQPGGPVETVVADPRLRWPDTLAVSADGYLYVTANQLHLQKRYRGTDERQKPYALFRVKIDSTRITAR